MLYNYEETANVAMVTLNKIPSELSNIATVFKMVAKENISVDMISQTAPYKDNISISFTILESDLTNFLIVLSKIKEKAPELNTSIVNDTVKFVISNDEMKISCGVAAEIFEKISETNIKVLMITTAENEISILVNSSDAVKIRDLY